MLRAGLAEAAESHHSITSLQSAFGNIDAFVEEPVDKPVPASASTQQKYKLPDASSPPRRDSVADTVDFLAPLTEEHSSTDSDWEKGEGESKMDDVSALETRRRVRVAAAAHANAAIERHPSSESVASNVAALGKKSTKVQPEQLQNSPAPGGRLRASGDRDNRSDNGSQMSRSSVALFHKNMSGLAREEPSLVVLRQLLLIIAVLVAATSITTMSISKSVITDSVHRLEAQDIDGDRVRLQQVLGCCLGVHY